MANSNKCCSSQAKLKGLALLDLVIVMIDVVFDYYLVWRMWRENHQKEFFVAIFIIFLPGVSCTIASFFNRSGRESSLARKMLTYGGTIFFYAGWILAKGFQTLKSTNYEVMEDSYKSMVHHKAFEGLLESSYQFLLQVIIIKRRPPVGASNGLTTLIGDPVPNGEMILSLLGIGTSFLAILHTACQYHVLVAERIVSLGSMAKVAPFFSLHIITRTAVLSFMFIFLKEKSVVVLAILGVSNGLLTWFTKRKDTRTAGYKFTLFLGSVISPLCPVLAVYYDQAASQKTIRKFTKRNIRMNNTLLFIGLTTVIVCTHVDSDLQRFHPLIGCKEDPNNWTLEDLSLHSQPANERLEDTITCSKFLGDTWLTRRAFCHEFSYCHEAGPGMPSCTGAPNCTEGSNWNRLAPHFLVPQICCQEDVENTTITYKGCELECSSWTPMDKIQQVAAPVLYLLLLLSFLTSFTCPCEPETAETREEEAQDGETPDDESF